VLTSKLGWIQAVSYDNDIISYRGREGQKLVIKKSNKMSFDYVQAILRQMNVDYVSFCSYYTDHAYKTTDS